MLLRSLSPPHPLLREHQSDSHIPVWPTGSLKRTWVGSFGTYFNITKVGRFSARFSSFRFLEACYTYYFRCQQQAPCPAPALSGLPTLLGLIMHPIRPNSLSKAQSYETSVGFGRPFFSHQASMHSSTITRFVWLRSLQSRLMNSRYSGPTLAPRCSEPAVLLRLMCVRVFSLALRSS